MPDQAQLLPGTLDCACDRSADGLGMAHRRRET